MSDSSNFTPLPQQQEDVLIRPRGIESEPIIVPVEKVLQQEEEKETTEGRSLDGKKNPPQDDGTEEELNELREKLEEKEEEKPETSFGPKLPLPDEEIEKASHAPISSSLRWMATMCRYILWQSGITLVSAGGKLVRRLKKR